MYLIVAAPPDAKHKEVQRRLSEAQRATNFVTKTGGNRGSDHGISRTTE